MLKSLTLKILAPLLLIAGVGVTSSLLPAATPDTQTTQQTAPATTTPAALPSPAVTQIEMVETGEIVVTLHQENGSGLKGAATVILCNKTAPQKTGGSESQKADPKKPNVTISALLKDSAGVNRSEDVRINDNETFGVFVGNGKAEAVQLYFSIPQDKDAFKSYQENRSLALAGYLFVSVDGSSQNRPLKLSAQAPAPPPPSSPYSGSIVMIGVVLAVAVVLAAYLFTKNRKGLRDRMALPEWKAGESLVTNFMTINGVIGITATASLLPVTQLMQKAEYTSLFLLFSLLVAVAPFSLQAIRIPPKNSDQPNQSESIVGLYLISSIVSLLGMIGHIPTVYVFLKEFRLAKLTSPTTTAIFQGLMITFGILLLIHSSMAIHRAVKSDETAEGEEEAKAQAVNINKPAQAGYWL